MYLLMLVIFLFIKFNNICATIPLFEKEINILIIKPVLTLLPICNSDIATDLPFSVSTVATDGKQFPDDSGGGGSRLKYENNHWSESY